MIELWINGKLIKRISLFMAKLIAEGLKRTQKDFEVIDAYEIKMLIIFSPDYGQMNQ